MGKKCFSSPQCPDWLCSFFGVKWLGHEVDQPHTSITSTGKTSPVPLHKSVVNLLWYDKIAVELTKLLQQFCHHYIASLIVICNNPVYARYMHQGLAQSCQLGCLFPPWIGWCNKIDFWKACEVLTSGVLVQEQTHQITYSLKKIITLYMASAGMTHTNLL
jgi:hypothetical protein